MRVQTLAETLLFTTVLIEAGGPEEKSVGTGFAFVYESDELSGPAFFMVTNKHVIADAADGSFVFNRADKDGNLLLGKGLKVPVRQFEGHWHSHPNNDIDIAVSYLNPMIEQVEKAGYHTYVRVIDKRHIAMPDQINDLDAVEEIMFIGYPDGLYDEANLTPIIRRGTTATPLQLDYNGEPAFLIDASVFPGSSGSPVFIANSATYVNRQGEVFAGGSRTMFLGVVSAGFFVEESGKVESRPIPTAKELVAKTEQMIDLGFVYKASMVIEACEDMLKTHGAL